MISVACKRGLLLIGVMAAVGPLLGGCIPYMSSSQPRQDLARFESLRVQENSSCMQGSAEACREVNKLDEAIARVKEQIAEEERAVAEKAAQDQFLQKNKAKGNTGGGGGGGGSGGGGGGGGGAH